MILDSVSEAHTADKAAADMIRVISDSNEGEGRIERELLEKRREADKKTHLQEEEEYRVKGSATVADKKVGG